MPKATSHRADNPARGLVGLPGPPIEQTLAACRTTPACASQGSERTFAQITDVLAGTPVGFDTDDENRLHFNLDDIDGLVVLEASY